LAGGRLPAPPRSLGPLRSLHAAFGDEGIDAKTGVTIAVIDARTAVRSVERCMILDRHTACVLRPVWVMRHREAAAELGPWPVLRRLAVLGGAASLSRSEAGAET
jgi:hypothetical protein